MKIGNEKSETYTVTGFESRNGEDRQALSPLRERNRDRVRTDIIGAASTLIDERGFEAVTIADIADMAGMSYSSFFRYFKSKEDLVLSIEQAGWENYESIFSLLEESSNPFAAMLEAVTSGFQLIDNDAVKAKEILRNQQLIYSNPTLRAAYLLKDAERTDSIVSHLASRIDVDCDTDVRLRLWVERVSMIGQITLKVIANAYSNGKTIKAMDVLHDLLEETDLVKESERLSLDFPVVT